MREVSPFLVPSCPVLCAVRLARVGVARRGPSQVLRHSSGPPGRTPEPVSSSSCATAAV